MSNHLIQALESASAQDPTHYGLRFIDRNEIETWFSWETLQGRVARTAGSLWEAGIRAGDRVGIILPTRPEFIDVFLACQSLGATPAPLYPPVRLGRLTEYHEKTAAMLQAIRATAVITDNQVSRILGETLLKYKPRLGLIRCEGLANGTERAPDDVDPERIGLVQFSSGTTADPKPVALTHRQMIANAKAILSEIYSLYPPENGHRPVGVSWLPLYHDMGLIGCILPALLGPGQLNLLAPEVFLAKPALWLRAISRHKGNVSPAPNFAYGLCVERVRDEDIRGIQLDSWRMALNGAEPIAATTLRRFEERFGAYGFRQDALLPVYGLSEATLAVTFPNPGNRFRTTTFDASRLQDGWAEPASSGAELVSCGEPLEGFAVEVREGDQSVPEGKIGRIWASGPSLMTGYLDRKDSPIHDGWLDTGDLGFLWQGELYVTGRAKDVLIVHGQNHAPHDLERAVDEVPGVRTGCSAAVTQLGPEGERVLLFVEIREPTEYQAKACQKAVLAATGIQVQEIILLEPGTLPRTSSGKIRRGETLRRWQQRTLAAPEKVNLFTMAGALARSAIGHLRAKWQ